MAAGQTGSALSAISGDASPLAVEGTETKPSLPGTFGIFMSECGGRSCSVAQAGRPSQGWGEGFHERWLQVGRFGTGPCATQPGRALWGSLWGCGRGVDILGRNQFGTCFCHGLSACVSVCGVASVGFFALEAAPFKQTWGCSCLRHGCCFSVQGAAPSFAFSGRSCLQSVAHVAVCTARVAQAVRAGLGRGAWPRARCASRVGRSPRG